jgi:pilus assembly protein CpaF
MLEETTIDATTNAEAPTPTRRGKPNSMDVLVRNLPELAAFVRDPAVTEIMVNPDGQVFTGRGGQMHHQTGLTIAADALTWALENVGRLRGGYEIGKLMPLLEASLDDGSRLAAAVPPASPDGPMMTIRKFGRRYTLDELVERDAMPAPVAALIRRIVTQRKNILISGGTDTGKTTMLNALADTIPDKERILIIEDTSEIHIDKPNRARLESRREGLNLGSGKPAPPIPISDLLRFTLRSRPDRIILGEVRGHEAWDFLQAMNTGHPGSMTTAHGNNAAQALMRMEHGVLMAGINLPVTELRHAIALAIQVVVQIERSPDGVRQVTQVLQIDGYHPMNEDWRRAAMPIAPGFITTPLYLRERTDEEN